MRNIWYSGILWLSLPGAVYANSTGILEALGRGFGNASPAALLFLGIGIIGAIGALVVWEILRADNLHRQKAQAGWQAFYRAVKRKGLNQPEAELIREIASAGNIESADTVFESAFVYEDCLDKWMENNLKSLITDESKQYMLRSLREKLGYAHLPMEVPLCSSRQLLPGSSISYQAVGSEVFQKAIIADVKETSWSLHSSTAGGFRGLAQNEIVVLSFLRGGDGEYRLSGRILEVSPAGERMVLTHTRDLTRKQLRNFVRVDVNLPCKATIEMVPGDQASSDGVLLKAGQSVEGRLVDISGGGTCARFGVAIPPDSMILLNFDLPGTQVRGVKANVIRQVPSKKGDGSFFEHHVKFSGIETVMQEKIVRYVFEKQRVDAQWK